MLTKKVEFQHCGGLDPVDRGGAAEPPKRRSERARQVADILRAQIHSAGLQGPLPDEVLLARRFQVSRNALREALDILRREGLVERTPGLGTFAAPRKVTQGLDRLRGLAETFHGVGEVNNAVLQAGLKEAPPFVCEFLGLGPSELVLFIERLRYLDGEPISLESSYLPAELASGLLECDLHGTDKFSLLEKGLGLKLGEADLAIEATVPDQTTSRVLESAPGVALLLITRTVSLEDGRPVDIEFLRYRGDRISLSANLIRKLSVPIDGGEI